MRHTDAETLRSWLDEKRPVTVLDVRSEEDRAQWSIPGSVHLNVYEALKAGQRSALSDAALPDDKPIVTVCNLGKMSERAAEELSARGLDVSSLSGGMKAWSLAWNTAEVPTTDSRARIIQVRRTGKGCLSYIVGSGKEALVIDASLPARIYLELASRHNFQIRYVLDTHVHADHLSRSVSLAQEAGATLFLPAQDRVRFPFTAIGNGDTITIGKTTLTSIGCPGHTLESSAYLVNEKALFTGDTLFLSGVGRPDLHTDAAAAGERARLLFHSVKKLLALGRDVVVLPGHTGEPIAFDGKAVTATLEEVGSKLRDWLSSEEGFIERILQRIPPTPPNYMPIVELNEAGILPDGDPTDLEAGANRCAVSS